MTYEEFEWNILKLAYEDGLEKFQPSFLAYALGLPHETVSAYLEQATHAGLLEMDVTEDGRIEYFVPGVDANASLPKPLWKDEFDEEEAEDHGRADGTLGARADEDDGYLDGPDGSVTGDGRALERPESRALTTRAENKKSRERKKSRRKSHRRSKLPAALRAHIEERYGDEDGSVTALAHPSGVAVVERDATVHDADDHMIEGKLVKADEAGPGAAGPRNDHNPDNLPLRIETGMDTFTDPSQTIFMRQLKVYGVQSEQALREHVERLFTSFGYNAVQANDKRLRFERGSVTFILALVPLFVLVLPLFVYLFLYCMGRSTIQQEPVELDVQLRKLGDEDNTYEIDLTFIGMHGVVLGAADQRVLNQEVDTLRDELQWALSSG